MKRSLLAFAACLTLAGCAYSPLAADLVRVTDTPADVRACKRLGVVAGPFHTTPGELQALTASMREQTVALGGNVMLYEHVHRDWSVARTIAYSCKVNRHNGW